MDTVDPGKLLSVGSLLAQRLSIFDPASPNAQSIVDLAILTIVVVGLIFVAVEGVLFYCIWRFRQLPGEHVDQPSVEPAQVYGSMPIEIAWTAAPTMIVLFLVLVVARTLWEINPPAPQSEAGDNTLFVTVVGHQWWWEYIYESYNGEPLNFTTANELHIPASDDQTTRPVYLTLKSADVCHSYWVPRLGGKVDLIPGHANSMRLETKETGLHLGQCAEFCGAQHANMLIRVVVDSPTEFDRWLENESAPAIEDPDVRDGKAAFLSQSCVNCHQVRGTPAVGSYAPDLTHLMTRKTLASGILENTPENLLRWVHDPQSVKAGCLMPAFGLEEHEQNLIMSYLQSLR